MKTAPTHPQVIRSHRASIRAKWLPETNRIVLSKTDGTCRMYVKWQSGLDTGEMYAYAVQQFLDRYEWSGVWIIGSTDDGAVAVWGGDQ